MNAFPAAVIAAMRDALALLAPIDCAGCGCQDRGLCDSCKTALHPAVTTRLIGTLPVTSAVPYESRVRGILLNFKEHGRTDVAPALSGPLAAAIVAARHLAAATAPYPELALVPTSRTAYRRRGYDPVRLLARRAGFRVPRLLVHARSTGVQKSLGLDERALNLAGAFAATGQLTGRSFIVVDDILTSGATILEASRALREAGAEVLGAATIAFTPRLLPFRDNASEQDYGRRKGAR